MKKIAILMSSFNRCTKTLACLNAVYNQKELNKSDLKIFLVDDSSTDGTAVSVAEKYPKVQVMNGTGDLFWNRSMRIAFAEALKHKFDYYLLLNDDVQMYSDALKRLKSACQDVGDRAIIVGSVQDPNTGVLTYGGVRHCSLWHPLKYSLVTPSQALIEVDTMNGNLILVPSEIAEKVGNLDACFHHSIGDFDYGLRTRKLGFKILLAPGYLGTCPENNLKGSWADPSIPRNKRWQLINHPKGLPPKEWKIFARRYAGLLWPFYWILPYLRILLGR